MKNDVKVDKEVEELLYKGMLNMREFLLNKKPHIKNINIIGNYIVMF